MTACNWWRFLDILVNVLRNWNERGRGGRERVYVVELKLNRFNNGEDSPGAQLREVWTCFSSLVATVLSSVGLFSVVMATAVKSTSIVSNRRRYVDSKSSSATNLYLALKPNDVVRLALASNSISILLPVLTIVSLIRSLQKTSRMADWLEILVSKMVILSGWWKQLLLDFWRDSSSNTICTRFFGLEVKIPLDRAQIKRKMNLPANELIRTLDLLRILGWIPGGEEIPPE